MITTHTPEEIAIMTEGGRKLGNILSELLEQSQPGVRLIDIEQTAMRRIKEEGCQASFTTVEDYKWATCLCVNDGVVHCIPTGYTLKDGDVLTIDIGLINKGFHSDTAWSKIVTSDKLQMTSNTEKFLKIGEETLWKAIAQARGGNRVGDISRVIQEGIEGNGYHIIKSLVGHGVGRELHEEPQIPGFVRGESSNTPQLKAGMTIAVEIIYAEGTGSVIYDNDDGWTIATRDGSLSAVFEHSIAITEADPIILTAAAK